jgi:gas vesicle protein
MIDNKQYPQNNNIPGILAGVLIGGLAGATAMLLVAPQSGRRTRHQIQLKGMELRDETTGMLEGAMAQMWLEKNKFTRDMRRKSNQILHSGQALAVDKFEQVSESASKVWRKAI